MAWLISDWLTDWLCVQITRKWERQGEISSSPARSQIMVHNFLTRQRRKSIPNNTNNPFVDTLSEEMQWMGTEQLMNEDDNHRTPGEAFEEALLGIRERGGGV